MHLILTLVVTTIYRGWLKAELAQSSCMQELWRDRVAHYASDDQDSVL